MRIRVLLLFLIIFKWSAFGQNSVTGFVFEDTNRNLVRDGKEAGIPGVAVSNGQEVVLSGQDGRYELPIGTDDIIFVVKPANYKTPVDANNLPRFYYIHKPNGSPVLKYAGVSPTGKLPRSVDFGLFPETESDQFDVLLFGDPQTYNKNELHYFDERIVSELVKTQQASFGISVGDLVGDNPDLFVPYAETVAKTGIPWYNVIGNHDMNYDVEFDEHADESFERVFGPSTYSFNFGKTHFIILKDILRPDPRTQKGYWGGFTEKQLRFVKNDLKLVPKDHLVVLAFHVPLSEDHAGRDIFRDEDRLQLFTLLKDFPNTLSVSAHSHIQLNKFFDGEYGWLQQKPHHHLNLGTTCGDWYRGEHDTDGIPVSVMADGTPQGYAFLRINKNEYTIDYKAAGYPEDYKMSIYHPKVMVKANKSLANIYVNYFMGSERDEVKFRIDGGKWTQMNYTIEPDPSYRHIIHKWDFTEELLPGRRPGEAKACFHLWKAILPSNLAAGEHQIEIQVTDSFGNTHEGKSSYRIELPGTKK